MIKQIKSIKTTIEVQKTKPSTKDAREKQVTLIQMIQE